MTEAPPFPATALDAAGLNRQHLFDLAALPETIRATLGDTTGFSQLLLIGHGGRRLWECVQASGIGGSDPIDDYTRQTLAEWFARELPGSDYRILYPGDTPVGLQALGELAGWHHPTPFRVGIDAKWGSWFAYRAAVLCTTRFSPFFRVHRAPKKAPLGGGSPCASCDGHPCVTTCPANALAGEDFDLDACLHWRMAPASTCADTCLARLACPVGAEHRYDAAQIRHSYGRSLDMLRHYLKR